MENDGKLNLFSNKYLPVKNNLLLYLIKTVFNKTIILLDLLNIADYNRFAECLENLKAMPNGKSPGTDGFPVEFYKVFWIDLKDILLSCYVAAYRTGKMSILQRRGIITLIPKNSVPFLLKNWRPISLLNMDYKIATRCIASCLKQVLPSIIHSDQTGYLKGRYIGENVRLLFDIIEHAQENEIPGLLFFADFEKAFDTLNHNFIMQALNFFKFGNDLKQWISVFYQDCTSCVINNGYASPFFNICRGVRQGCPLSPYLFIICIELLAIAIRNDPNLEGIVILNCDAEKEIKISLYADDTTLLLPGKEEALRQAIGIFNKFGVSFGLTLNLSKYEVLRIGSLRNSNAPLCSELNLRWASHIVSALGVVFSTNQNTVIKLNYKPQLEKIQNVLNMWRERDLSLIGKTVILKALAISKLVFLFCSFPNPDENFFCRLKKILQCFLWNNKPPKIKY